MHDKASLQESFLSRQTLTLTLIGKFTQDKGMGSRCCRRASASDRGVNEEDVWLTSNINTEGTALHWEGFKIGLTLTLTLTEGGGTRLRHGASCDARTQGHDTKATGGDDDAETSSLLLTLTLNLTLTLIGGDDGAETSSLGDFCTRWKRTHPCP